MIPWYGYAFITALAYGMEGVYLKYFHRKNMGETPLVFATFLYSLPFLSVPAGFHLRQAVLTEKFLFYLVLVGLGNGLGFYYYSKAIRNTEVSVAVPVLSLSPVLVVPFSFLLLGQLPGWQGFLGLVFVVCGLFFLSWSKNRTFRSFFIDKGVRYALLTVLIWGVVANIDKLALNQSHPLVYPFFSAVMITVFMAPFGARKEIFSPRYIFLLLGLGLVHALLFLFHMLALQRAPQVAYVIAIKRLGMIVAILLGRFIFKEERPGMKFLAALFFLIGIYLIVE